MEEQVLGKINGDFTHRYRESHNSQVSVELHGIRSHTTIWLSQAWQSPILNAKKTQDRLLLSVDFIKLSTLHLNNGQCKHTSLSCSFAVNANMQRNHTDQMDQLQPVYEYSWQVEGDTFMHFRVTEGQYSDHWRSCRFRLFQSVGLEITTNGTRSPRAYTTSWVDNGGSNTMGRLPSETWRAVPACVN